MKDSELATFRVQCPHCRKSFQSQRVKFLLAELNNDIALRELEHSRYIRVNKIWQKETGRKNTWCDLGELIEWLAKKAGI